MGIIKILALSAAGVWSARAVGRLNAQVQRIPTPAISSLARYANDRGHFYADSFVIALPKRVAHSRLSVDVSELARSFFSSKAFCGLEKPLLKLIFSAKEPPFVDKFLPGERILLWTVTDRVNDEILLEWRKGNLAGFTWFHVSPDQRVIMFGSSIGYPNKHYRRLKVNVCPYGLLEDTYLLLKDNPQGENLFERSIKAGTNVIHAAFIGVHQFYSRVLLLSTLKTLVLDEP